MNLMKNVDLKVIAEKMGGASGAESKVFLIILLLLNWILFLIIISNET